MATTIVNNFISPRTPFELVIKTDNLSTGSTADNQFQIPHYSTGTYNYKVDWGDGTVEIIRGNTSPTHTYGSIGTYNVKIWGIFAGVGFSNTKDRLKLLNISSVDRRNKITRGQNAFDGCSNLSSFPSMDISGIDDIRFMWANCSSMTTWEGFGTPKNTASNYYQAWQGCSSLQSFPLITFPSTTTTIGYAWGNCTSLTEFPPIVLPQNCTNIEGSWRSCVSLQSFPDIDTSNVVNFNSSWEFCQSLTSFPALNTSSGILFQATWRDNRLLTEFPQIDVSEGTLFSRCWQDCKELVSFPPLKFDSATNMSFAWMHSNKLQHFPAGCFDDWTGVPVAGCFGYTWEGCTSLTSQSVENILVSIDTSGQSAPVGADITISYNVATGTLSPATNTAITNLKARGWKPHINNVYV